MPNEFDAPRTDEDMIDSEGIDRPLGILNGPFVIVIGDVGSKDFDVIGRIGGYDGISADGWIHEYNRGRRFTVIDEEAIMIKQMSRQLDAHAAQSEEPKRERKSWERFTQAPRSARRRQR